MKPRNAYAEPAKHRANAGPMVHKRVPRRIEEEAAIEESLNDMEKQDELVKRIALINKLWKKVEEVIEYPDYEQVSMFIKNAVASRIYLLEQKEEGEIK